jgi:membrane associated rhomboid family serine protease
MLEDRDYMRQSSRGPNWSATIVLVVINCIVFLLQPHNLFEEKYFALSLYGLAHGYVWQLVTFQFLHAGWLHIIFNMIVLYFFGRTVEAILGKARFLQLYFASGIIGGLVQMVFAFALPNLFGAPVVGASAGISGLVAAFAALNWMNRFTLYVYFFPVLMRGRTLFWAAVALAVGGILYGIFGAGTGTAHAAHLGGLLTGFAFIKYGIGTRGFPWKFRFANRKPKRDFVKAGVTRMPGWSSKGSISADLPEEEFISKEVDPILDKISAHGIQSLTAREREILERARSKMGKR